MNKVERIFQGRAIKRGGIYLYSKKNALEFIIECKKMMVNLFGIDGFIVTIK